MKNIQVITGAVSNASLLTIAQSIGLRDVINLRRVNGDEAHCSLVPFSGGYSRLIDSVHGIRPMSALLGSNPELYIPHSQ